MTRDEIRKEERERILELLKAAEWHYRTCRECEGEGFAKGLALAVRIAGECGWNEIAPAWIEEMKKEEEE